MAPTVKIGGGMLSNEEAFKHRAEELISLRKLYNNGPIPIVVSAMEGETDRLWEEARKIYTDIWWQLQYVAENGEYASAPMMKSALEERGASAKVATALDIEMIGTGKDPESGILVGTNQNLFDSHIKNAKVDFVIIPGYVVAHGEYKDDNGKPLLVALGRNSSDLIAVEIARRIDSDLVYFVKSADFIYTVDPRLVDNPRPIKRMSHEQALKFLEYLPQDDQFVMRRAVKHAHDKGVEMVFGSLNSEEGTRITASSNGEGISQFAALPVKQNAAIIRFTISSGNKHRARLQEKLQDEGVNFADINEIEDFAIGRVHYELYTDSEKKDALAEAVRPFANDRRIINIRDVALITLIDTDLDPEGHHTNLVANAFAETDIQYTKRTSGTILHIPVSPKDTREAVKLLAEKFALIQNTD